MPLQNRVDPFGAIIRTPERGHWTGNRGVLHNKRQEIGRPFRLKAWITCRLEFKGRWRKVMSPGKWTELFFFDEATAFAAGHRPCFECRREDAVRFKRAWVEGNREYGFDEKTPVGKIDEVLHRERVVIGTKPGLRERVTDRWAKVRFEEEIAALPSGTFIEWKGDAWLVKDGFVYKWSPGGYAAGVPGPAVAVGDGPAAVDGEGPPALVMVLTPRSVVNAFRAGYVPEMRFDLR